MPSHDLQNWKSLPPVVQIKGSLRDSVWTSEFDTKHLKIIEKCHEYNNKDEVSSPNILSNNNYQASS